MEINEEKILAELSESGDTKSDDKATSTETAQGAPTEFDVPNVGKVKVDELISGYMKGRDYTQKTQEVAELRKQMDTVMQMVATKQQSGLDENQMRAVFSSLLSAKAEDPDAPVSRADLKEIAERTASSAKQSADDRVRQLEAEFKAKLTAVEQREFQRDMREAFRDLKSKYPYAHEKAVYSQVYADAAATGKFPDIEAIVKDDHESRKPSSRHLADMDTQELAAELQKRVNAKKKPEPMRPEAGNSQIVDYHDEELQAILSDRKLPQAEKIRRYSEVLNKKMAK